MWFCKSWKSALRISIISKIQKVVNALNKLSAKIYKIVKELPSYSEIAFSKTVSSIFAQLHNGGDLSRTVLALQEIYEHHLG